MQVRHIAFLALALLAGTAGYVAQQWRHARTIDVASGLDAPSAARQAAENSNMLGLNPHIGAAHPFQSMLPGYAAAAAAAASNGGPGAGPPGLPHGLPPVSSESAAAVAAAAAAARAGAAAAAAGAPVPPPPGHPLHNVPINMWPLIWNHITK